MKKYFKIVAVSAIVFANFLCQTNVYADTQVFVDGQRISNTLTKDGKVYAQLRDLSHYTGYTIEYDEINNTVNYYKSGGVGEKPIIKRESSVFPTQVNEITEGERRETIKIYELSNNENPREISREPFESNGYAYSLTDITKSDTNSTDTKEHTEPIEIGTASNNVNSILGQLPQEKEVVTDDGYKGVLKLDVSSVKSEVKGYKSSSYTATATREYPNLSAMDTSSIPKTITENGKTYTFVDVQWQSMNSTAVDFTPLPDEYKAVVKYTTTGTKSTLTGYTTTAEYKGTVSKNIVGKTVYTAYFLGAQIVTATPTPQPTKAPTVEQLQQQLKDAKTKEKQATSSFEFNWFFIAITLFGCAIVGGGVYFFLFRKNVIVENLQGDKYKIIGKKRVTKKNPVIDLTDFASRVTNPTFLLTLDNLSAKWLKDERLTINYGADSTHQDVIFETLPKEGYKMAEIEFRG